MCCATMRLEMRGDNTNSHRNPPMLLLLLQSKWATGRLLTQKKINQETNNTPLYDSGNIVQIQGLSAPAYLIEHFQVSLHKSHSQSLQSHQRVDPTSPQLVVT